MSNAVNDVEIFSYHYKNQVRSSEESSGPKLSSKIIKEGPTYKISHFTPILQRAVSCNASVKSSSKNGQPAAKKPIEQAMISAGERESRSRKKVDAKKELVPHLYADQRIRERSLSRDPHAAESKVPQSNRDVKKIIAFGRTTTVENKDSNARPVTAHHPQQHQISNAEFARFRTDIEALRKRVEGYDGLKTEIKKMQKQLNEFVKTENELNTTIQELRKETSELRIDFSKMAKENAALVSRLSELEKQVNRVDSSLPTTEESYSPSPTETQMNSHQKQEPGQVLKEVNQKSDNLYTCLPSSVNRQLRDIGNDYVHRHLANNTGDRAIAKVRQERHDEPRRVQEHYSSGVSSSQRFTRLASFEDKNRHQRPKTTKTKKDLQSNQIIELNDTYDKDDFPFNDQ